MRTFLRTLVRFLLSIVTGKRSHSWACGRVRSFATGKGGARKADKDLLKKVAGGVVRPLRTKSKHRGCGAVLPERRKTTKYS